MTGRVRRERKRADDGTGGGGPPQDDRATYAVGLAGLAGWILIMAAAGGVTDGRVPEARGATGLAFGSVGAAGLAAGALWVGRRSRWSNVGWFGVLAATCLAAWTAASVTWSIAPDLSWLASNRTALGLGALLVGLALGSTLRRPSRDLALGLWAATTPILLWALGSRAVPDLLSPVVDTARIAAPIGHPNGLALVAVIGVPGALLASGLPRWRGLAAAWFAVAMVTIVLTGSRSGVIALAAVLAVAAWWFPARDEMVAAVTAGLVGAVPAAFYGLLTPAVADDPLPPIADRRLSGLALGMLVVVGAALAPVLRTPLLPFGRRIAAALGHRGVRWTVAGGAAAIAVAGGVLAVVGAQQAGSGASRLTTGNHRWEWWQQAARGFADAPVAGHGAGSFPFTNLLERSDAFTVNRVRQPHNVTLELMSELGIVGIALALAVVGAILVGARRAGRTSAPALAIVLAFVLQAQLDIPWSIPALVAPAAAAAGVILASGSGTSTARAGAGRFAVACVAGAALVVSAIVPWVAGRHATDAYVATTRAAGTAAQSDPDGLRTAIRSAERAADLNRLAAGPLLIAAQAHAQSGRPAAAAAAAREAVRRQPDNPFAWECLAATAAPRARPQALARMQALDPRRDPALAPACRPAA